MGGLERAFAAALAALLVMTTDAHGEDPFEDFRQAFIAGDRARVDALLGAHRGRLPVDADGVTVLHKAIHVYSANRPAIVARLIAAGLDVNAPARDGRTPLHWAAGFGCAECVTALVKAGAQIGARNEDGDTPLHGAASDCVPLLLAAGGDPLAQNRDGNVPLHRNFHAELLAPGVNVRNRVGLTPLHYAALSGNEGAIAWLLGNGADPEAVTSAPYRYRASFMSKAFGPGDEIPAGSRPYDLAKARHEQSRWSTGQHAAAVEALDKVTKRRGWFSR